MKSKSFHNYKHSLVPRARDLRKNFTLSEALLWEQIKGKQILDYKFRRQAAVDGFIIDFYCKELRLALEIDGISHDYKIEYDKYRIDANPPRFRCESEPPRPSGEFLPTT